MTHGSTPPGWYDDGRGGRRWWDGTQWAPEGQGPAQQPYPGIPAHPGSPEHPGYPGYPGAPGGRPSRSRAPLLAVLAVVVVALVAFAVTAFVAPGFLLSDDGDDGADGSDGGDKSSDSGPGDPADTVQDFVDAAQDGGCEAAEEFVTESFFEESGGCDDDAFEADGIEFEVGEAEVDGDEARVPLTFIETDDETGETSESTGDVLLVVVDDEWKIDGAEAESDSGDAPTG